MLNIWYICKWISIYSWWIDNTETEKDRCDESQLTKYDLNMHRNDVYDGI